MKCLRLLFSCALLHGVIGSPTLPFHSAKSYGVFNQQDFYSTLSSIEERLRSIDQILVHHSSLSVKSELVQIQIKLDSLESKVTHLESAVNEISEITRNNEEAVKIIIQAELNRFLENKMDEKAVTENIINKLEKIEDEMTSRDEDTRAELSDIIGLMEDLKSPCYDTNSEFSNEITENPPQERTNGVWKVRSEYMKHFREMNKFTNWSTDFLHSLKTSLQQDLNDYANKVADMNSGFWEAHEIINKNLQALEKNLNLTKSDLQSLFKKFMIHLNKRFHRNSSNDFLSDNSLEEMTQHINSNFEKVLSTQNLFLESCYKLQNDDSQIESRIDDLLQIITEELETKSIIGLEEIRQLATMITNHDDMVKRYLKQDRKNYSKSIRERANLKHDSTDYLTQTDAMNPIPEFLQYTNYTEIYVQKSITSRADISSQTKLLQEKFIKRRPNLNDLGEKTDQVSQKPEMQNQNILQNHDANKIHQERHEINQNSLQPKSISSGMDNTENTELKPAWLDERSILNNLDDPKMNSGNVNPSNDPSGMLDSLENYEDNGRYNEINNSTDPSEEVIEDNAEINQTENNEKRHKEDAQNIAEYKLDSSKVENRNEDENLDFSNPTTDSLTSTTISDLN